jgi:hypothetical protein
MPGKKKNRTKKRVPKKRAAATRRKAIHKKKRTSSLGGGRVDRVAAPRERGLGPGAAGQSSDIQGLSDVETADSESVEELVEEGQALEAGLVAGVEDAPDADVAEVTTRETPEDDVPNEYRGHRENE